MLGIRIDFDSIIGADTGEVLIECIDHRLRCILVGFGTAEIYLALDLYGIEVW